MSNYNTKFRQIMVQCPARPYDRPEKMEIRIVELPSCGWTAAPCNGCDSMNGTMPCEACCREINALLAQDPFRELPPVIRLWEAGQ